MDRSARARVRTPPPSPASRSDLTHSLSRAQQQQQQRQPQTHQRLFLTRKVGLTGCFRLFHALLRVKSVCGDSERLTGEVERQRRKREINLIVLLELTDVKGSDERDVDTR